MAVIISDAGPLIALAGIQHLTILQTLFKHVLIPEAVWQECIAKADKAANAISAAVAAKWLEVCPVTPPQGFPPSLGDGEQAAMQLAATLPDSLLLMDDRLARREALQRKLHFVGTAKVLWIAEQRGLIHSAADLITLMAANGYHISPRLLVQIETGTP